METDVELQGTATGFRDYYFFFPLTVTPPLSFPSSLEKFFSFFKAQIWSVPGCSLSYKFLKVSQEVPLAASEALPGKDAIGRGVNSVFLVPLAGGFVSPAVGG